MYKINNTSIVNGFQTEGQCRENSFYVRFNDEEINELSHYAFDMGYSLEPEIMTTDPEHPVRFKISCKTNPSVYGWISMVIEKTDEGWKEALLYGFYRHGSFRNKYPITFNVQSQNMRGVIKRNTEKDVRQDVYFRTLFGILDLEPECNPLDFILSWLWSVKFRHI